MQNHIFFFCFLLLRLSLTSFISLQINGVGQHFYSAVPSFAGPGPHFHTIPGGHLQPQTMHSQHSPSPPNTYHKDERSQRQHTKLLRKLDQQKQREMSKFKFNKS